MSDLHIPDEFVAHAMWSPRDPTDRSTRVVFVTERRRRRIAMWMPIVPIGLAAVGLLFHHILAAYAALVICGTALIGAVVMRGGRGGFYQLTNTGELGDFIGHRPPDLTGLRRQRVRSTPSGGTA